MDATDFIPEERDGRDPNHGMEITAAESGSRSGENVRGLSPHGSSDKESERSLERSRSHERSGSPEHSSASSADSPSRSKLLHRDVTDKNTSVKKSDTDEPSVAVADPTTETARPSSHSRSRSRSRKKGTSKAKHGSRSHSRSPSKRGHNSSKHSSSHKRSSRRSRSRSHHRRRPRSSPHRRHSSRDKRFSRKPHSRRKSSSPRRTHSRRKSRSPRHRGSPSPDRPGDTTEQTNRPAKTSEASPAPDGSRPSAVGQDTKSDNDVSSLFVSKWSDDKEADADKKDVSNLSPPRRSSVEQEQNKEGRVERHKSHSQERQISKDSEKSRERRGSKERSKERSHRRRQSHWKSRRHRRSSSRDRHDTSKSQNRHWQKEGDMAIKKGRNMRSRSRSRSRSQPTFKQQLKAQLLKSSKYLSQQEELNKALQGTDSAPTVAGGPNEKPSSLPLVQLDSAMMAKLSSLPPGQVLPQLALYQTMSAMHNKAQEITGVAVPKYYNQAAMNPLKYAETIKKRKLLWSKKAETVEETPEGQWQGTAFMADNDGKVAAKFRKLMGIKAETASVDSHTIEEQQQKRAEFFDRLDNDYEFARITTHQQRGVGFGYQTQPSIDPNVPRSQQQQPQQQQQQQSNGGASQKPVV